MDLDSPALGWLSLIMARNLNPLRETSEPMAGGSLWCRDMLSLILVQEVALSPSLLILFGEAYLIC